MTKTTIVSVKTPVKMLEHILASKRGRMFAKLLEAGRVERYPLLNEGEFERELRARRGRNF